MTTPPIGRIVLYKLGIGDIPPRIEPHEGNRLNAGDVYPMMIVSASHDTYVQGQVFVDGNYSIWAPSAMLGEVDENGEPQDERTWVWPVRDA